MEKLFRGQISFSAYSRISWAKGRFEVGWILVIKFTELHVWGLVFRSLVLDGGIGIKD